MNMSELTSDISSMGEDVCETTDPMLSVLIEALSGKGQIDSLALLRTQLDAQARDNPKAAQILRLLEQQRLQQLSSESQDEEGGLPSDEESYSNHGTLAEEDWEEKAQYAQELEDTVNEVYTELEALRARNDALAAALGACYLCFGDDVLCKECGGRGVPGSRAPKPAAFRKYVLPAFRRAKAIETGGRRSNLLRERVSESERIDESPPRPRREPTVS